MKNFSQKRKLLDVGAATGRFLEVAKERGWEAYGVEISEYASRKAREKGLNVITGAFEDTNFQEGYFDTITFLDTFEHLSNSKSILALSHRFLKKDGILAINTPDSNSLFARFCKGKWYLLGPPEHLFLFNLRNLSQALNNLGFEVVIVSKIGKRFTLRYIARRLANWQKFFVFD